MCASVRHDAGMEDLSPSYDVESARQAGRNASLYGLIATAMSLLGMCSSCMTLFLALPLGIMAIMQARRALESDDELARAQGQAGMALGLMSTIYAALWLLIILMYVLMYVGMIAMVVGAGAAQSGN